MQKTYWWRFVLVIVSLAVLLISYFGPCDLRIGRCLGGNNIPVIRMLFHVFLAILVVVPITFFINNNIFVKWIKFSFAWFILEIILVAITPEYSGGWVSFNPEKEEVLIWTGSLFVILSLVQIVWQSRKAKND